ncbi:BQ2448_4058 [Microbotryum intermedium]|uniref:BQ2448_4058 protein n=1 Tax=Microbotryum intermedium TaxID=269621 RepID=A0A238FK53_9BASI|nr:BQ2448_4058 [Microbotryum intermedium]
MKCSLIVFVALASTVFAAPRAQLSNIISEAKEQVVQSVTESKCANLCTKFQTDATAAYCPKICNAAAAGWAAAQAQYKNSA